MKLRPHPHVVLAERRDVAVDVVRGSVIPVPMSTRPRVTEVFSGEEPRYRPSDLPLLQSGLALVDDLAENARAVVQHAAREYLESAGALSVMPTERCNLRCTYCYETFEKGGMKPAVERAVVRFLEAEVARHEHYSLGWFGGEPLLQPELVLRVSKAYREALQRHGKPGSVTITTNGTRLTPELVTRLDQVGVDLYHISLDGPPEVHDRQRPRASGAATYGLVEGAIDEVLARSSARVIVRTNLRTDDAENATRVARWLRDHLVPRYADHGHRVQYTAVSVWDASTTSVDGVCLSDLERFRRWFQVEREIKRLTSEDHLTAFLREVSVVGALACYAGKPGHYVVGADGAAYKCSVAFDLEENRVGRIRGDGSLQLDSAKEARWTGPSVLTDKTCAGCSFGLSCLGLHCPLERMQDGRNPCPPQKRFVQEILAGALPSPCN